MPQIITLEALADKIRPIAENVRALNDRADDMMDEPARYGDDTTLGGVVLADAIELKTLLGRNTLPDAQARQRRIGDVPQRENRAWHALDRTDCELDEWSSLLLTDKGAIMYGHDQGRTVGTKNPVQLYLSEPLLDPSDVDRYDEVPDRVKERFPLVFVRVALAHLGVKKGEL